MFDEELFGLCTEEEVMDSAAMAEVYERETGRPFRGLNHLEQHFRPGVQKQMFVADSGCISEKRKFRYRDTCAKQHHGLCRWVDRHHFSELIRVHTRINAANWEEGSYRKIEFAWTDDSAVSIWWYVCFQKRSNPRHTLFCEVWVTDGDPPALEFASGGLTLASASAGALIKKYAKN